MLVGMAETDQEKWLRRVRDAAIEAVTSGAGEEEIRAAVAEGVREGRRILDLRRPAAGLSATQTDADRRPAELHVRPGSAVERLLNVTRNL